MHRYWQLRGSFLSSLHKNYLILLITLLTLLNLVSRRRASSERATRGTVTLHPCGRLLPSPKISAPENTFGCQILSGTTGTWCSPSRRQSMSLQQIVPLPEHPTFESNQLLVPNKNVDCSTSLFRVEFHKSPRVRFLSEIQLTMDTQKVRNEYFFQASYDCLVYHQTCHFKRVLNPTSRWVQLLSAIPARCLYGYA